MKILRIRGRNLASLAGDFDVDFEHGPLAGAGLFAISGPTGAGKSTLLDAVCLALFDETPRSDAVNSRFELLDADGGSISNKDVRAVLRRGTGEGFAEVTFTGQDERRYVAKWAVARARGRVDGRLQAQKVTLHDVEADLSLGGTKTETLNEIQNRVGLSFHQFRRSVLLAQGDFAAFLKARTEERAELLERMTGTELYGDLSRRAHERANAESNRLKELEREADADRPLSAEERLAREEELKSARASAEAAKVELLAVETASRWWQQLESLEKDAETARQQLAAAQTAWTEAAPRREELSQVEAVQPLRSIDDAARQADKELERARKEAQDAATALTKAQSAHEEAEKRRAAAESAKQEAVNRGLERAPEIGRARQVDAELARAEQDLAGARAKERELAGVLEKAQQNASALEKKLEAARRQLAESDTWLAGHPLATKLARDWERTQSELRRLREEQETASDLAKELSSTKASLEAAEQAKKTRATEAIELQTLVEKAHASVKEAESLEAELPSEERRVRRELLARTGENLASLERTRTKAEELDRQIKAKRAEATQADAAAVALEERAKVAAGKLEPLATRIQATEDLQQKAAAIRSLDDHRKELREGDACPLCGATEHPGIDPAAATEDLFRQTLKDLQKEQSALSKEETTARAQAEAQRTRAREAEKDSTDFVDQLTREAQAWTAAREALADQTLSASALEPSARETLARLKAENDTSLSQLALDDKEAERRAKAAQDARKAHVVASEKEAQARVALEAATRACADIAEKHQALTAKFAASDAALAGVLEALGHVFTGHADWRAAVDQDAAAFEKRCGEDVQAALDQQARKENAEKHTADLAPLASAAKERAASTQTQHQTARVEADARERERDETKAARATLLEGRPVAEVESELKSAVDSAEARLETARKEATDSGALLASARTRQTTADKEQSERSEAARLAGERLTLAATGANLDLPELRRRLAFDIAWLETRRSELQRLERARNDGGTLVAERTRRLQAHQDNARPEQTREQTAAALEPARAMVEAHQKTATTAELLLKQDDERRGRNKEAQQRVDRQKDIARLWESMRTLIGSSDGKRFRTFAQSLTLEALVEHANLQLKELAPRYRLQRVPKQDVDLQIIDGDMGDEIRSVTSLSGGETFLVSLALALGLSSLASDRVRIESLFIDEGFGSLDPQTLETALATLDSLQAAGRKVGLISHVPGLADRIGVQVRIEPLGAGRSGLEVLAA